MATARKVTGLRCRAPVADAARTVLAVRLNEVSGLRSQITGEDDAAGLHSLRIAAKRLRYSLETFAVCFPDKEAESYADRVRELQDILGRIHDLDALEGLLAGRIALMDHELRRRGMEIAITATDDEERRRLLREVVHGSEPEERLGIFAVIAFKATERRQRYAEFESLWVEWEISGFLNAVRAMIEPPTDTDETAG